MLRMSVYYDLSSSQMKQFVCRAQDLDSVNATFSRSNLFVLLTGKCYFYVTKHSYIMLMLFV
jgi:hypothetical protein